MSNRKTKVLVVDDSAIVRKDADRRTGWRARHRSRRQRAWPVEYRSLRFSDPL